MANQPAICTQCGGKLEVDDVDLNGFCKCEYCGTSHKIIDIITVDGLPTVKTLLENAKMSIEDVNLENAVKLYKEAIKIKPNCHEAWWGLYLCNAAFDAYYNYQDKYGNSGPLTKASIMEKTITKYANRAIEYAPPEQAEQYKQEIQSSLNYINDARSGKFDKKTKGKFGCYIATAVYGSYECQEVLTLRRYRDDYLSKSFGGRLFIKFYYKFSPFLAKNIKKDSFIGKKIRKYLDKKVKKLSI